MTNTELKSIRKSLDLSKTDFARAIGISPVMEGKYEKGSREIPEAVSQAAIDLLNSAEQEADSSADEEVVYVVEEDEAVPVVDEAPAEEATPAADEPSTEEIIPAADEPSAEEVTPAADENQAAPDLSASTVEEEASAAVEKSPAKVEKNTAATDASSQESDVDHVNWAAAAVPFFLPPLLAAPYMLSMGFMMSQKKKKGFFGQWW